MLAATQPLGGVFVEQVFLGLASGEQLEALVFALAVLVTRWFRWNHCNCWSDLSLRWNDRNDLSLRLLLRLTRNTT